MTGEDAGPGFDAPVDGPTTLECTITTACNLRCSYCHQDGPRPRAMAWETLRGALDRVAMSDAEEPTLALTGGEPLLEWDNFRRLIAEARALPNGARIKLSLLTNGLLLDAERVAFLVENDVEVQISVDGLRPAHELRAPGTFDRLDRLLVDLRRDHRSWFRRRVAVGMTLTSANLPYLASSIAYLLERGVEAIRMGAPLHHDQAWNAESEAELRRQFDEVFRVSHVHFHHTGKTPLELLRRSPKPPEEEPERPVCRLRTGAGRGLGVDGSEADCQLLLPTDIGGTRSAPILATWAKDPAWPGRRRDRHSSWGRCSDCEFVDECLVCPVASANIPGNEDPARVPDFNCTFNRVAGAARRRFPPQPGPAEILRGEDELPEAMLRLGGLFGI